MDSCAEKGVALVVRLLPAEPSKDIGFAIMSQFHYAPDVRIVTCATMEEAANYLVEWTQRIGADTFLMLFPRIPPNFDLVSRNGELKRWSICPIRLQATNAKDRHISDVWGTGGRSHELLPLAISRFKAGIDRSLRRRRSWPRGIGATRHIFT
jgi:hypothetical protein